MAKTKKEIEIEEQEQEINKDAIDTEAYIAKLNQDLEEQKKKADGQFPSAFAGPFYFTFTICPSSSMVSFSVTPAGKRQVSQP